MKRLCDTYKEVDNGEQFIATPYDDLTYLLTYIDGNGNEMYIDYINKYEFEDRLKEDYIEKIAKFTNKLIKKGFVLDKPDIYTYLVRVYGHGFCIDGSDYKVYTKRQMYQKAVEDVQTGLSGFNNADDLIKAWKVNKDYQYNLYFDNKDLQSILDYDIVFIHDIIQANDINADDIDLNEVYMLDYAKTKRRLVHAVDVNQLSVNVFNELGTDGRDLLKQIEKYKYKITQTKELVVDEKSQKQIQKCIDDLDNVSAFVYNFVYDLENHEHVNDYDKQIEYTVPENADEEIEVEQEVDDTVEETTEETDMEDDSFAQAEENDEDFELPEEEEE